MKEIPKTKDITGREIEIGDKLVLAPIESSYADWRKETIYEVVDVIKSTSLRGCTFVLKDGDGNITKFSKNVIKVS